MGMPLSTGPWAQARHQHKILDRITITPRLKKMVREVKLKSKLPLAMLKGNVKR